MLLLLAIPLSLELIALTMGARLLLKADKVSEPVGKFCRLIGYIVVIIALFAVTCTTVTSIRMSFENYLYAKTSMMQYRQTNAPMMNTKAVKMMGVKKARKGEQ